MNLALSIFNVRFIISMRQRSIGFKIHALYARPFLGNIYKNMNFLRVSYMIREVLGCFNFDRRKYNE